MSAKSFCCITEGGGGGGGGSQEYYISVMSDGGTSSWGGGGGGEDVLSRPLSCLLSKYSNSSICFKDTVSAKSFCCVPLFSSFFPL